MRKLLRWATNLYPQSWKNRYGHEFEALLEDVTPRFQDLLDITQEALYMQIASRGYWQLAACFGLAGALLGALVSVTLPRSYLSTAVLRTESREGDLASSSRINSLAKSALSENFLLEIINQEHLYDSLRRTTPIGDLLVRMKQRIVIRRVQQGAFTVHFIDGDPAAAQNVTRDVSARLISIAENTPGVRLEILDAATRPHGPISPNPTRITIMGLVGGLMAGSITWLVSFKGRMAAKS